MRQVDLTLSFEEAESLLFLLQGSKLPADKMEVLADQVSSAIREASRPEATAEPRYVGEHGEYNPNTLGKSGN